jgi:hypothetical protein
MSRKNIPFDFVLELLDRVQPYTRPMFGCTSVYVKDKIVLILRQREAHPEDNGVWIATTSEHHESLKKDFPSLRSIGLFESQGPTGWQVLPEEAGDFEESVNKVCDFILAGDLRIGKIPKSKLMEGKIKKSKSDKVKKNP